MNNSPLLLAEFDLSEPETNRGDFTVWLTAYYDRLLKTIPAISRAWLAETVRHDSELGSSPTSLSAGIEGSSQLFTNRDFTTVVIEPVGWGRWAPKIEGWRYARYEVLAEHQNDTLRGPYLTNMRATLLGSDTKEEQQFSQWWTRVHMPAVAKNPGFHRAWVAELQELLSNGHEEPPYKYWSGYEVDRIEDFVNARRGELPWDGVWSNQVKAWTRVYQQILVSKVREA